MLQFLDLLSFSKRYWYLKRNCSLANLYLNDSRVGRPSEDAFFCYSSYQSNENCACDVFSAFRVLFNSLIICRVFTANLEINTLFTTKATHSLGISMIPSATISLLTH